MKTVLNCSIILLAILMFFGCTAAYHQRALHSAKERQTTVGIVQKEIKYGMSQAEVAAVLGSPNIVTKDSNEVETWIYDKIATEASYSSSRGGIGGLGAAGGSLLLGIIGGSYSHSAGAVGTTQRTLTVIIKFNRTGKVNSFSYHSSKF